MIIPAPSPLGPPAADPAAVSLPPTQPIDISEILAGYPKVNQKPT